MLLCAIDVSAARGATNITYAIALMNAWNRVAIGFQVPPRPRSV